MACGCILLSEAVNRRTAADRAVRLFFRISTLSIFRNKRPSSRCVVYSYVTTALQSWLMPARISALSNALPSTIADAEPSSTQRWRRSSPALTRRRGSDGRSVGGADLSRGVDRDSRVGGSWSAICHCRASDDGHRYQVTTEGVILFIGKPRESAVGPWTTAWCTYRAAGLSSESPAIVFGQLSLEKTAGGGRSSGLLADLIFRSRRAGVLMTSRGS